MTSCVPNLERKDLVTLQKLNVTVVIIGITVITVGVTVDLL